MLYFFRTQLNEAYIANASFTKPERTFICCLELYFFFKKYLMTLHFNLTRDDLPYLGGKGRYAFCSIVHSRFLRLCRVKSFLRLYVSVQSGKYLS